MMEFWLRCARRVDALSALIARLAALCALLMVVIGAYNALARYLTRDLGWSLSSNRWIELQWYLFSALFLLGAAHVARVDEHVRVDVLYSRLPARGRAWIDLLGTALLMLPFCAFAIFGAWGFAARSLVRLEGSPDPEGLPRWPIKMLMVAAFILLFAQALALVIERVAEVRGQLPLRGSEPAPQSPSRADPRA